MVSIKKISFGELKSLVQLSYEGDNELFNKYHIQPMEFQDCVNTTIVMIKQAADATELSYYKVVYDKKPIGYVAYFEGCVYSFSIAMGYRKKEILIAFWNSLRQIFKNFTCAIYRNNTRAIEFLIKSGMWVNEEKSTEKSIILNFI